MADAQPPGRTGGRFGRGNGGPSGHIVVFGEDTLALRLVQELRALRETVVVVAPPTAPDLDDLAGVAGVTVLRHERAGRAVLRAAGVARAKAVAVVHEDDIGNVQTALAAQELNPELRLVIRMFNTSLGRHLAPLFRNGAVLSASSLAAPAFVAAAVDDVTAGYCRIAGRSLYAGPAAGAPGGPAARRLAVLADVRAAPVLLPDGSVEPAYEWVLTPAAGGERPRRVSQARQSIGRLAAVRRVVDRRMRWTLGVFAGLAVLTGVVLGPLFGWARGVYYAISLVTATGSSDLKLDQQPVWLQLFAALVQLVGLLVVAVLTAVAVDVLVGARLARVIGGVRGRQSGHVVVVGLGNVGVKVVDALRERGIAVVAVEQDEDRVTVAIARRAGAAIVIGDGTLEETQRTAQVESARAVIAVTSDDVANLEAGIVAKQLAPAARIVLRLFDPDLAVQLDRTLELGTSRSVSYLAASAFAAALVERRDVVVVPVERRVLLLAELPVGEGSALDGGRLAEADRAGLSRVLAVRQADGEWDWDAPLDLLLRAGDEVAVVASRAGLTRALLAARTPAPA